MEEEVRWIKCSEKLPENEHVVEVTYKVPKMDESGEFW